MYFIYIMYIMYMLRIYTHTHICMYIYIYIYEAQQHVRAVCGMWMLCRVLDSLGFSIQKKNERKKNGHVHRSHVYTASWPDTSDPI